MRSGSVRDHVAPCHSRDTPPGRVGDLRTVDPKVNATGSNDFMIISPLTPLRIRMRVLLELKVGHCEYQVPQPGAGQSDSSVARMISVPNTGSLNLSPAVGTIGSSGSA